MKNKLLKVGALTLCIMLAIYFIIIGSAILLFPKKTAKVFSGLGNYKFACKLYEIEYKRNPSADNLKVVIDYCVITNNDKKVVSYGQKLLSSDKYEAGYGDEYYLDFTLNYIKSYYVTKNENSAELAIELAIEKKDDSLVYCPDYSAITVLSANCYKNKDKSTLLSLSEKLQEIITEETRTEQQKSVQKIINDELDRVNNYLLRLS